MVSCCYTSTICSGGSRISPRRGHQLPLGVPTYDFAKFSRKLHEIEGFWMPGGGGGGRISRPPLDPPMICIPHLMQHSLIPRMRQEEASGVMACTRPGTWAGQGIGTGTGKSVSDLRGGGTPGARPPQTNIFSISCSFSENLVKIVCWHTPLEGWCPLLRKSRICPWKWVCNPMVRGPFPVPVYV